MEYMGFRWGKKGRGSYPWVLSYWGQYAAYNKDLRWGTRCRDLRDFRERGGSGGVYYGEIGQGRAWSLFFGFWCKYMLATTFYAHVGMSGCCHHLRVRPRGLWLGPYTCACCAWLVGAQCTLGGTDGAVCVPWCSCSAIFMWQSHHNIRWWGCADSSLVREFILHFWGGKWP